VGKRTAIQWTYGAPCSTSASPRGLTPEALETVLTSRSRREFVAGARQLSVTQDEQAEDADPRRY